MNTTPPDAASAARPQDRLVAIWLGAVCTLVVAMILVGGATRLTDSGLSITEWNFAKHFAPPLTAAGWEREFALYRETAEYQHQNAGMSLGEFQFIYLWEWGHRFLGQTIGLVFALPFFAFLASGRLRGRIGAVALFGLLGGLQGAVGWWMVKSGLAGRLDVSPLRLAIHLAIAFVLLGYGMRLALAFWTGQWGRRAGTALWAMTLALLGQIILGAFVAGSDAGRAFVDWPTINGEWFPSGYAELRPWSRNLWENLAAAQFNHRTAGYLVFGLIVWTGWRALRTRPAERKIAIAMLTLAGLQVALGVATVLNAAPLALSLIHQAGAAALWIGTMYWSHLRASYDTHR